MPNIRPHIPALLALLTLSACGTTRHFVDQPPLAINQPDKDPHQAITELFEIPPPYNITLCEADPTSKQCRKGSPGITAKGVGGLFLPLTLHVKGMSIQKQTPSPDGLAFDASLDAKVYAIPSLCGTVGGKVVVRDNNTASVQLRHFYCNWAVVGNVIVNADLSIDSINLNDKVVTGFYKVTFYGTGNAAGSGYYRAVITPKQSQTIAQAPTTPSPAMN
jgi:hypothetical protein